MKLIFLRHGQAQHNLAGINQRQRRDQLTDQGHRQAHQAAVQISRYRLAAIYSSPQLRACQTAQIVANYCPNLRIVIPDKRLRDQPFAETVSSRWLQFKYRRGLINDTNMEKEVLRRQLSRVHKIQQSPTWSFLKDINNRHQKQIVLAVGHLSSYWLLNHCLLVRQPVDQQSSIKSLAPGSWCQFNLDNWPPEDLKQSTAA